MMPIRQTGAEKVWVGILRDAWDWWWTELLSIRLLQPAQKKETCFELSRDGLKVLDGTTSAETKAVGPQKPIAMRCNLVIAGDRYVARKISDARLPHTRALEIAAIDLADNTPFSPRDVYLLPTNEASAGALYCLLRKDLIDPCLDELRAAQSHLQRLGVRRGEEIHWLPARSLARLEAKVRGASERNLFLKGLATATVLLVLGTYLHLSMKLVAAEEHLEAVVSEKRGKALQVRAILDQRAKTLSALEAARSSKAQSVPVTSIWEELTRVLPETAWLTDFSVEGDNLTLSGFAEEAAPLITSLDASPLFADPAFTGSVNKIPGQSGEHFDIRLRIVRP